MLTPKQVWMVLRAFRYHNATLAATCNHFEGIIDGLLFAGAISRYCHRRVYNQIKANYLASC